MDNDRIKNSLGQAILNNEWSHAYLLIGSRGTGKTTTARLIAKTVNCPNRKKGEEPCNKCESCQAVTAGSSVDVIEIDAASHTGVDDIRDLREKARLAPTASKFKVYIIDEVHMLSTSAFNALLKTLEEPPTHVIFILATTDPHKLPETITSRCLISDFGKAEKSEIISGLKRIAREEKLKVNEEVLVQVTDLARGSHRDAAKILEQLSQMSANIGLELIDSLNASNFDAVSEKLFKYLVWGEKNKALPLVETETGGEEIKVIGLTNNLLTLIKNKILTGDKEVSGTDFWWLTERLMASQRLVPDCPVPQLPLEAVLAEWFEKKSAEPTLRHAEPRLNRGNLVSASPANAGSDKPRDPDIHQDDTFGQIVAKWPEIVAATKPFNHSLMAVLKAGKPKQIAGDYLIVGVLYKFHKEKLEETKNRDTLEKVISDIIGKHIKTKFELEVKKNGNV